jgi:hypothetical protein
VPRPPVGLKMRNLIEFLKSVFLKGDTMLTKSEVEKADFGNF